MRSLVTLLPLAGVISTATAAGSLGFALGDKKADGTCKFTADYESDFETISKGSTARVVRGYAASDCDTAKEILPAAKAKGFKVVLGIWPDTDESFAADKAAVVKYAPQYSDQVYAITVGSESLYRGNFTGEQLLEKIMDVKTALNGDFKVGTADSWNKYMDGTADPVIKGGADILLCNAFSYWQGQELKNATHSFFDDIMQAFGHIQDVAGSASDGPELWVGETGWPTAGSKYQSAVPGTASAKTFWQEGICGIMDWGVNVFSFEAFDEPWKPVSTGSDGSVADETHWGDPGTNGITPRLHDYGTVNIQTVISTPPRTTTTEAGFELQYPDPFNSPALSTTSTAEGGGSSPILPPLPEPTINGHTIDLFGTPPSRPPSEPRTDTSAFYTASWGSPYLHPLGSSVGSRSLYRSAYSEASEDSEDLPIRHLELHTPFLRPPPAFTRSQAVAEPDFVSHDGLISAAVLANRARRPAHRLTEDWIRQHTGGESTERNNWLSDDNPGESENSSLSGSISGGAADSLALESDPRTPTLLRFVQESERLGRDFGSRHRRKDTSETLTQEDIAAAVRRDSSNMSARNESGSQRTSANHTPVDEKPLPPPPLMAQWAAKALPNPTPSPTTSLPPRLKKKVPWKGKNILVLLPWDEDRGKKGGAPKPMTPKDVVGMLKDWEELGYDTSGFNLGSDDGGEGGPGQGRNSWPTMIDVEAERAQRTFRVNIPDRKEWDAYVEELKEAKLRALGVSLGDDDPIPIISPAILNLSRRTSMQYPPLPFSPPIPTSSTTSSHIAHKSNLPFSLALMPGNGLSTSQSSNQGSIASPASMHAHLHGKFGGMRHNSVSFGGGDHPFGSPFQYPQPTSSPGVWSPQQMLYQHGHRGGSPSMHNLGSIRSPASPLSQDGYFPQGHGDAMSRQILMQNQLSSVGVRARASPGLQEVRESEDEKTAEIPAPSKSPSKTPTLEVKATIKHNASASLQKEIDDAEYHLEEQFQRQLDGDDYSPHSDHGEMDKQFENKPVPHVRNASIIGGGVESSRFAAEEGPVLHHPQPHSRGHSLSQHPFQDSEQDTSSGESKLGLRDVNNNAKYDLSDIETNPSNLGTPTLQNGVQAFSHNRDMSMASNPWLDAESTQSKINQPSHRANKQSMSTLNVAARPFSFNPVSSFQPNQFSFTGGNFQPAHTTVNYVPFAHQGPLPGVSEHPGNHSVKNSLSEVNDPAQVFSPNLPGFVPGHSEFNFQGPSFRPDAPTFTPNLSNSINSTGEASGNEAPRNPIFGGIDMNSLDTSKLTKKSKAIPIMRPDSSHSKEAEETMEGKDGRPMQNPGNIKRIRRGNDDGDSVPLFAEPTVHLQETTREQSAPEEPQLGPTQDDKENSAPSSESVYESLAATVNRKPSGDAEYSPFAFQQQKQVEDSNAAIPLTAKRYEFGLPGYGVDNTNSEDDMEDADDTAPKQHLHLQAASNASGSQLGHRKMASSLSANATPFESQPKGNFAFTFGGSQAPILAPASPVHPKIGELAASRHAKSPSPPRESATDSPTLRPHEVNDFQNALPGPQSPPQYDDDSEMEEGEIREDREPTFEEIDAVMRHLNSTEMSPATTSNGDDTPRWHAASPQRHIQIPSMSSPIRLHPNIMRSDAPSPSPGPCRYVEDSQFGEISPDRVYSHMIIDDDPFADPHSAAALGSPIHRLNTGNSLPVSDWDDVLSEGEEIKLHERIGFFDNRVNDIVGSLLADRLDPIEKILEGITHSLQSLPYSVRAASYRREQRSMSGALSDADDEDDEDPGRSASPRRNAKLERIRTVVLDALNAHSSRPQSAVTPTVATMLPDSRNVLQVLDEMKEQFAQSSQPGFSVKDLRNAIKEVVEERMPAPIQFDDISATKLAEAEAKMAALERQAQARLAEIEENSRIRISELEEKLRRADDWVEEETKKRRATEDSKAMTERLLVSSLEEEHLLRQIVEEKSSKAENEIVGRRKAEDRLAEAHRLLRVYSEEEDRLGDAMLEKDAKIREIAEDRDRKVRSFEESRDKTTMRIALLEAAQENYRKTEADLTATVHMAESELRESRSLAHRWQLEAEGAMEAAKRHSEDAEQANETNRDLRRTIETLKNQMEESIRVRESMRSKLMDLQEDMATAARNISQDNSHRAKKEQELLARQEVLDAKLHAEARTRERLELEIERLESGERQGMRAINECKRLESVVTELRNENHAAHKDVMRHKREFEEARESGLGEVARTRKYMQVEVDTANNEVNVVREELENQISRLQVEIDLVKLDAETAKEQHDMLLEAAQTSKKEMFDDITRKHQDQFEDLQEKHKRQLENTLVDAQRSEQHLLERLSLSTAKTEHLQDRVSHLEDKLDVARSAAQAAAIHAKAARSASVAGSLSSSAQPRGLEVPEKISPQALRESLMALQEQLQDRELKIEDLEQKLTDVDPEASTKISKRDDEITWLRELLSVRKSDLQDIVHALSTGKYNSDGVRDAAIRLSANLQMEEQERERAMNGGSAINFPNIAASIAASPRVAQVASAVGPLAAAWGNWRNKNQVKDTTSLMSDGYGTSTASGNSTPPKAGSSSGFLSGLMTPPASNNTRQYPSTPGAPPPVHVTREPTNFARDNTLSAFDATGQRFAARQSGLGSRTSTPRRADKVPVRREVPSTPPMMLRSSYDIDAVVTNHDELGNGSRRESALGQPSLGMSLGEELGDFGSEEGFYDDDESTVDEMAGIYSGGFGR
ncbi:hypothetical protein SBOR_5462 [Sclerotinia borealis F-4128]|uniref:Glycoside hydrolase family 17 protein n=1 Tax=Sclerotinia borealis (strain F-4128) TaxID=1432307 RepID=W9CHH6_SCLBF|nr:hypothetical protein SBOR_5462 [Sclerotinia borealis F-4128]